MVRLAVAAILGALAGAVLAWAPWPANNPTTHKSTVGSSREIAPMCSSPDPTDIAHLRSQRKKLQIEVEEWNAIVEKFDGIPLEWPPNTGDWGDSATIRRRLAALPTTEDFFGGKLSSVSCHEYPCVATYEFPLELGGGGPGSGSFAQIHAVEDLLHQSEIELPGPIDVRSKHTNDGRVLVHVAFWVRATTDSDLYRLSARYLRHPENP